MNHSHPKSNARQAHKTNYLTEPKYRFTLDNHTSPYKCSPSDLATAAEVSTASPDMHC